MLASQENVYLTTLHSLNVSNESEKARTFYPSASDGKNV